MNTPNLLKVLGCVTLVTFLICTTACSPEGIYGTEVVDESNGAILTPEQYQAEYEETVASFPERLPDGFEFNERPPRLEGDVGASLGTASAYFQWYCGWADVYFNDQNVDQQRVALEELYKFGTTDWALQHFDDPENIWNKMLDQAQMGDPSMLKNMTSADCNL